MAELVPGIEYAEELEKIRRNYVTATPRQRLSIIRQRLDDHHYGPNRLVTIVSAVEAFARSLLINHPSKSKAEIKEQYRKFKHSKPEYLVEEFLKLRGQNDPAAFLKEDNWTLFKFAVEYRNMVTHECTYLGLDKFPSLIEGCEEVLEALVKLNRGN